MLSLFTVRVRGETIALGYQLARCEQQCALASERASTLAVEASALVPTLARAQGRLEPRVAGGLARAGMLSPGDAPGLAQVLP